MEEQMKTILNMFEIKKLGKACNAPGCKKKPDMEAVFYQKQIRKGEKSIAKIYICSGHAEMADMLAKELKKVSPKYMITYKLNKLK